MYSIENIPDTANPLDIKLTPRSNQAMKTLGYTLALVVSKSAEQVNLQYKDLITDPDIITKRYAHYQDKRVKYLKQIRNMRNQIIRDPQNLNHSGTQNFKQSRNRFGAMNFSENSAQTLEISRMKMRQVKEIEQLVNYEMSLQTIRKNNEQKINNQAFRQIEKNRQIEEKKKLDILKKRQRDSKLKEKAGRENSYLEKKKLQNQKQEENRRIQELQKIEQKSKERKKLQEEQRLKQQEFQRKKYAYQKEKQQQIIMRAKQLQKKQQEKIALITEQINKKRQLQDIKRKQKQAKIKQIQSANQERAKSLAERLKEKQIQTQNKLSEFYNEKQKENARRNKIANEKNEKIGEVIKRNEFFEEQRRQQLINKQMQASIRRQQMKQQQNQQKQQKNKHQEEKMQERSRIRQRQQNKILENTVAIQGKIKDKEELQNQKQKIKQKQILYKYNETLMDRKDKAENILNHVRKIDYERQILMDKMQQKNKRAEQMKKDKQETILKKFQIKKLIQMQKSELMNKIEKVKQGKLDPKQLLKAIPELTSKIDNSDSSTAEFKENLKNTRVTLQGISPNSPSKYLRQVSSNKIGIQSDKFDKFDLKIQNKVNSKIICNQTKKKSKTKQSVQKLLQQHKKDTLKFMIEEQQRDNNRQDILRRAQPNEKKKLIKDFNNERVKVQLKIQKLQQQQKRMESCVFSSLRA